MRINVYAEEVTEEVELVRKDVTDGEFGQRTFVGLRVYLKSPDVLHHGEEDDDRSAITFWFREDDFMQRDTLLGVWSDAYRVTEDLAYDDK